MEKRQYILNLSCVDQLGIVAAVTTALAKMELFILELSQYSDPTTGQFFMRIFFEEQRETSEATIQTHFEEVASRFDMTWELHDKAFRPKVLLMVSKHSHCLNDLLHRHAKGSLPTTIAAVISNHADLEEMASWYQVPFHLMPITSETKKEQEAKLLEFVEKEEIDLIILARYMQILSDPVCKKMAGRIINIHHSFLPSFKGAKPYHQAFDRGVKTIGATAHYVTADLDEGPIIHQETIPVRHDQSVEELVQLGQDVECRTLSRAVQWHIQQRVMLNGHKTVVFN